LGRKKRELTALPTGSGLSDKKGKGKKNPLGQTLPFARERETSNKKRSTKKKEPQQLSLTDEKLLFYYFTRRKGGREKT